MKKTQFFPNMHLPPRGMRELDEYLTKTSGMFSGPHATSFETTRRGLLWRFDTFNQFITEYPQSFEAIYSRSGGAYEVEIVNLIDPPEVGSVITVRAPQREAIEKIFQMIEKHREGSFVRLVPPRDGEASMPQTGDSNQRRCRQKPRR